MTSSDEALQRALADACLVRDMDSALGGDLRRFLERRGVDASDVDAILAQPRRLSVYRRLVRNGLSGVVLQVLPRTRDRMNRLDAGRFDADFAAFVEEVGPRTHYLRDVPRELVDWAAPRWRADPAVPPFLVDLASLELTTFASRAAVDPPAAAPVADVALDRPLALHPSACVVRYQWAVHELSIEEGADDLPGAREVHLLAYRDAEHEVRWLELTPLAAAIAGRIVDGATLGDAVTEACAAMGARFDGAAIAAFLADLSDRGVLLGARV